MGHGMNNPVLKSVLRPVLRPPLTLSKGVRLKTSLAATKGMFPGQQQSTMLTDGVVTAETTRAAFVSGPAGFPAGTMLLDFVNATNTPGLGDVDGPNAITVKAVLEYAGNVTALFGGSASKSIASGAVETATVDNPAIPPNTRFDVRVFVSVAAGGKWGIARPLTNQRNAANTAGTEYGEGSNRSGFSGASAPLGSDQTSGTGVATISFSGANGFGFTAVQVRSTAMPASATTVVLYGTSIEAAEADLARNQVDKEAGWCRRFFSTKGYPYMSAARSGDQALLFNSASSRRRAVAVLANPAATVWALDTNDMAGGPPLAQFQSWVIQGWQTIKAQTPATRLWVRTVFPRTNAGNTAPLSTGFETCRVGYNDWLRDGAPMNYPAQTPALTGASGAGIIRMGDPAHLLYGYIELADILESARNSGLWNATYAPSDGIHPTPAGHTAVVSTLVASGIEL